MIAVVDYGGQYVHRIWRSLNYLEVDSKIVPVPDDASILDGYDAIILSGGPRSVYDAGEDSLGDISGILEIDAPILGICFGHQLIAHALCGDVKEGASAEYAEVEIIILDEDELFKGLGSRLIVWESHRDEVASLPDCLKLLAKSEVCKVEAFKHVEKRVYGVQFHPEVHHTPKGADVLKNFIGLI